MRQTLISGATLVGAAQALNYTCTPSAIQAALPQGASVNFAYPVAANATFNVPKGDTGYPTSPPNLPALCAASIQVKSIGNTTYGFGIFLPEEWNGRFLAVGNGGFAGGINYLDMASGVRYGFAAISTDTGHNSTSGDGTWADKQPDKVENWGHLAMHGSVVLGKQITASYYKQNATYSYYSGCSTGGRQGLKEAEYYPEDFDGILAGAPAWWTNRLQPWTVRIALVNLPTTADYHIPAALFATLNKEIIKQCDPQDGVVDNIISDPKGCNFQPLTLLCGSPSANATSCFTGPQLDTVYKLFSDYVGANNTVLFPSFYYGSEGQPFLISGNAPNSLGTQYVQYFLGKGASWNFTDYNDDIIALSDSIHPGNASVGYDLSRFHAKGGKVLSYHGLSDPLIPTGSLPYYYDHLTRTLKPKGINVDEFFKYFLVPGMGHCSGTQTSMNAPWYFAGANQQPVLGSDVYSVPGFEDKKHDVLKALMAWVEDAEAPEYIIGTKYVNESTHDKVMRQRPICIYPKQAKYTGKGDVNDAANWECKSLY